MKPRRNRGAVAFLTVWLTLWTAAILVVLWLIGAAAWRGEFGTAPFLLLWLGFAAFGLYAGLRRLQTLLGIVRAPEPPRDAPRHAWRDGVEGQGDG